MPPLNWFLLTPLGLLVLALGVIVLVRGVWPGTRWLVRKAVRARVVELRRMGIRLNPLTLTRKQRLKEELLSDPALLEAARAHAAETGATEAEAMAKVSDYLQEIIPSFNLLTTYRFGKVVAGAVLRFFYRIRIGRSAEAELNAIPRGATVVYVMNHRSNADYLLVAYLLVDRVALSFAVGEWARVWPLEKLFRSFGSFFVRRHFREPLYHRVLERFVQHAVQRGVTQGIFLEGGLSRDGFLPPPKIGLLDYALRAEGRELVFIPVGINYDRVLEDRTLLREKADLPRASRLKKIHATALWVLGVAWRRATGRFHRFGYAVACFGKPLYTRDLLHGAHLADLDPAARKAAVQACAERLMSAIAQEIPLTPTALVAWAFQDLGVGPCTRPELKARMLTALERAESQGRYIHTARRDPEYAFETGLRVLTLRKVLLDEGNHVKLASGQEALLAYYAASIAHHLV